MFENGGEIFVKVQVYGEMNLSVAQIMGYVLLQDTALLAPLLVIVPP